MHPRVISRALERILVEAHESESANVSAHMLDSNGQCQLDFRENTSVYAVIGGISPRVSVSFVYEVTAEKGRSITGE